MDWGRRPLSIEQWEYAKADVEWVEKIFYNLRGSIDDEIFLESRRLFEKNLTRERVYNPKDWGMGNKPDGQQKIMRMLWEKREERAKSHNKNVGRICPEKVLKPKAEVLYREWYERGNTAYADEFLCWEELGESESKGRE